LRLISFLFLLSVLSSNIFAFHDNDSLLLIENNYYQKKDSLLNIKLAIYNLDDRIEISGKDFHYKIQPNFTLKTKFYFSYRFLSIAFAFAPGFLPWNGDNELKGKTKSFSLNMNIISKHWVQDIQYNYLRGYYLANTSDYAPPEWEEGTDPYIQFPDMREHAFRGATSYKFNSNFSLKAIRTHTEVQTKSEGSFMPSIIYSYYRSNNESNEESQRSSQKTDNFEIFAALWYMHTFVINKKLYFSVGAAPALGYGVTKLNTRIESDHTINYYHQGVIRINEQIGLGYNTARFFTGMVIIASQATENQGENPIVQNNILTTFQIFVGYRFDAPKFIKKAFNKIGNNLPVKK